MTSQPFASPDRREPMRITISPSAIADLESCPYRYAAQHLLRLPAAARRPTRQAIFGRILHGAIADFHAAGGWELLSRDDLLSLLAGRWRPDLYAPEVEPANRERAEAMLINYYDARYPPDVAEELGVELRLEWPRHRRGLLAVGRLDRVVRRASGVVEVVDVKTSSRPRSREDLLRDPASLLYFALARSAHFNFVAPLVHVSFQFLAVPGLVVTVTYDRETFRDNWRRIEQAAERMREGIRRILGGMPVRQAFPQRRGEQCSFCPLDQHCRGLLRQDEEEEEGRDRDDLEGGVA